MKRKLVRRIILFAILFALMIIVQVAAGAYIYNSLTQLVILLNSTFPAGLEVIQYKLDITIVACVITLMFFVMVLSMFFMFVFLVSIYDSISYYKKHKEWKDTSVSFFECARHGTQVVGESPMCEPDVG